MKKLLPYTFIVTLLSFQGAYANMPRIWSFTTPKTTYGRFLPTGQPGNQLTYNESAKSIATPNAGPKSLISNQPFSAVQPQYLRLQFFKDSVNSEQTTIRFISQTSTDTTMFNESHFEGLGGVSFSSLSANNENMGINTAKLPGKQSTVVRLSINATTGGTYQVKLRNLVAIPEIYSIWLMDAYKKDSLNLRLGMYSLDINKADSASFGNNRLSLVIRNDTVSHVIPKDTVLAYHLLDFTADKTQNGRRVQVLWKTENEEDNISFTAERSTDNGKNFDILGTVKANGGGTYKVIDNAPANKKNLYRLKQEDLNKAISYSQVLQVIFDDPYARNKLLIYPNPASQTINLSINNQADQNGNYNIRFMNSSGMVVKQFTSRLSEWQGNISNLQPGSYLVRVINTKTQSIAGENKFVKL